MNLRLLIAIKSCHEDKRREFHEAIRATWGKGVFNAGTDCGVDTELKFFVGEGCSGDILGDEVALPCPDDYPNLPFKTREILRHMLSGDYDYVYLADTDSYIIPHKLLRCQFSYYDYYGVIRRPIGETFRYRPVDRDKRVTIIEACYPWASGGVGSFLSHKAAEYIVEETPTTWAEDLWVAQVLGPLQKTGEIKIGDAKDFEGVVSWHFPQSRFKNRYDLSFGWMEQMYKEHR